METIGTNNAVSNLYKNPANIDSNTADVTLYDKLVSQDASIATLQTADTYYVNTNAAVLNSNNFNQTILVDTASLGTNLTITAPDPNGLTDEIITFINSPSGTKLVTVSTPTGNFGKGGSTFILYPGDTLKLMTLSALGYQILTYQGSNSGIFNIWTTLSTSQVLNLGSTPIQMIAAPGANQVFNTMSGWLKINYGGTAFASGAMVQVRYGAIGIAQIGNNSAQYAVAADSLILGLTASAGANNAAALATVVNQPMNVGTVGNVNFTTGNGSFELYLKYSIMRTSF